MKLWGRTDGEQEAMRAEMTPGERGSDAFQTGLMKGY